MGFFDRLGKAFVGFGTKVNEGIDGAPSAIGAAWTAASHFGGDDNWFTRASEAVSDPVAPVTGAITSGLGEASEALNFAYSYALARPVSTGFQQFTSPTKIASADAWNEAWNRSETISPGQAIVAANINTYNIGPDWAKGGDPFDQESAADREDFFRNTWWGKLSSGTIDAVAVIASDPGYLGLKYANKAQKAKVLVKGEDVEKVLAKGAQTGNLQPTDKVIAVGRAPSRVLEDGTELTRRQADQGQRLSEFIDRLAKKPRREIQAMPELQNHADANSLALLIERAKATYPDDIPAQRKAIADIIGTSWGDGASLNRLTARRDAVALDVERLTQAPPQNVWRNLGNGRSTFGPPPPPSPGEVRTMAVQRNAAENELARLDDVLSHSGQALGPTRVGSTAIERASERSALKAMNESWLTGSFAGMPLRMVSGAAGTKIPDHINVKDAAAGYGDMVNTMRKMKYTSPADKAKIMDSFVRAGTAADRMNVVKYTRERIVMDAAKKLGIPESQARELLKHGEGRMSNIRQTLGTRLYSAAGDERYAVHGDPEDDIMNVFDKPFLQSMLEDAHPMIDPDEVYTSLKIANRSRLLDNLGAPGTSVANTVGTVKDVTADVLNMATKLWKNTSLARGAYPLRIMTDTQARQMVHMETQIFMATRYDSITGFKNYLMSSKDNPETHKLSNFFKKGDLETGLTQMLTRDLGLGSKWNLTPEDVPGIVRTVMQNDGGMADLANEVSNTLLKKRRTGDFTLTEPNSKEWAPAYGRAVNQQILNSPIAIQALSTPDIADLLTLVRTNPALRREAREVGARFDRQEEWLRAVITANNHLLPTPELRQLALRKATNGKQFHEKEIASLFGGKNPKIKPMPVHGEGFSVVEQSLTVQKYNNARGKFFDAMASVPENILGRSPLFWDAYRKQIALAIERIPEDQIDNIGVDVIRKNAMHAARKQVGQILFDSSHSSNMASSMHLLSPFFSAWEDTMTKWGKLFYNDPQLFARINQGSQALNDTGLVVDQNGYRVDKDGHAYKEDGTRADKEPGYEKGSEAIFLPRRFVPGPLGKKIPEGGIKIRKDSINSVFQGEPWWLPGFGPLVALPVNRLIRDIWPKEVNDPVIKYILPYGTTTDNEAVQLLPKYAKTWVNAFGNGQTHANQYKTFLAEAVIDERNGGPKVDLDKIANKTRNYFLKKGIVDNVSPVSITPSPKYQFYIDKMHEYRADPKREDWEADYDRDFPGWSEIKLELSQNETGIQATAVAFDAQKRYRKAIEADPENGWLYLGPSNAPGAYNGAVHDWQVQKGYRTQKRPADALKDLQAEEGWTKYNKFRTAVNLALEQRGLVSLQQKGAEDLQYAVGKYREILGSENQAWNDAWNSGGGAGGNKPQLLLDKAQQFMKDHPERAKDPDMVALQKYVEMRTAVKAVLATREYKSIDYNPDLKYAMDAYAQSLVKDNLGFEQMWNRVLEYDNISKDLG